VMLHSMPPIPICSQCDERLTQASIAMRRHVTDMETAIRMKQSGKPTEEQRQKFVAKLVASFNAAQSAWDSYREHLTKHGLLTPASRSNQSQSTRGMRPPG
ncbi:MAG TPA: hypothetical protein VJ323_08435, partial [Bryobacteraceae bacterium]|nr:hypothetical protein [Bryobacteraceae bacterium]